MRVILFSRSSTVVQFHGYHQDNFYSCTIILCISKKCDHTIHTKDLKLFFPFPTLFFGLFSLFCIHLNYCAFNDCMAFPLY